jgi:hypothetical protein
MTGILIGLDDTDSATSRGTGFLARMLCEECERRGRRTAGVTRHQLLVDARIPFTSHNSAACVALAGEAGGDSLAFAFDFVAERSAEGSDPGVCIAPTRAVTCEIREFGRECASRIVEMGEARRLAREAHIDLRPLGGSGLGVVGALAAVGLRAAGNDGRFIDLPGLREMPERVAGADFARLGIRLEHRSARSPAPDDVYETLGWVRPNLVAGEPVLCVIWSEERNAWLPLQRKHSRTVE